MRAVTFLALLMLPAFQAAPLGFARGEQDSEAAATSKLTEAPLPPGAQRVLQKETVEQMTAVLKALYKDVRLGGFEALLWPGDYSGDKGAGLRQQAAKTLEKSGYAYADASSDQKIEGREVFVCSATRQNRRVLGVWIASTEAALLAWGEESASAGEAAFENVLYAVPKGWKADVAADGVTLTPTDLLPEEKLFVLILPGREFKGKLEEAAEDLWADTCKAFQVDGGKLGEKPSVYRSFKGWAYFQHADEVRNDASRLYLKVTFIQVGGRLERVAALTNWVNLPYQESPLQSHKYDDAVTQFLFGLKFKNHPEPTLPEPSLKGDGIVGVWAGLSMRFDGLRGDLEWKGTTAAFYTNGQVFYSAKLQTFAFAMSPYIAREVTPRWWGTYTFDKGTGTIKMIYGDIAMELKGEDLVLTSNKTPHKFVRLPSVDGMRLEGTWGFDEGNGKISTITFSENGRFSDHGALHVLEHSLYTLRTTTGKSGEGTYEVKNYTFFFHYSDGREFTAAYLGIGARKEDLKPATLTLSFNHDTLKRQ